jgi:hypothetical protein
MVLRRACVLALAGVLLCHSPAWAGPEQTTAATPPAKSQSSGKRVMWTVIGAGAGFAAGMLLGLNQFDDSTNSDRKVWTAALVGAAGGGIAGALLSRNVRRDPTATARGTLQPQADAVAVSWSSAVARKAVDAAALRAKIRALD